jgi:hypothetical protein
MPNNKSHEIKIALVKDQSGEHAIPIIPDPGAMQVGDTVRYVSSDGELRVEFPKEPSHFKDGTPCKGGSPFKDGTLIVSGSLVSGSQILTLESGGLFECRCSLTLHDGRQVGWNKKTNPQSGGVHDIQPH